MKLNENEKPKRREFIIHLHFVHPVGDRTDYFFGCLRAIFDRFPSDVVGTTLQKLWQANAGKGGKFVTRSCTIERVEVYKCAQKNKRS